MVREGDWKLVALRDKSWELYDLSHDPAEMKNLAAREPARVKRMGAEWTAWAERCDVIQKPSPQIANRPLTIHCDVTPAAGGAENGVLLAQGGNQRGYALYLKAGHPVFGVRENGELTEIIAPTTIKGKVSLEARLTSDGAMSLAVNGQIMARGKAPGLIKLQPQDGLSIGEDEKSAVGNYTPPNPFRGKVEHVRVETGLARESSD